jgi:hypothetical protein
MGFDTVTILSVACFLMNTQQKRLLTAKVAIALFDEFGRKPTPEEVEKYSRVARVLYKAVLGLHFEHKAQKATGQLAIF